MLKNYQKLRLGNRGDLPTNIFPKVSPIVVFINRNDLALVSGHLNQWFWSDFSPNFSVLLAVRGKK